MRRPRRGPTAGVRAHIPWQGRGGDQEPPIFQGIDEVDRRHEQAGGANLEDLASSQDGQPAGETGPLRLEMPTAGGATPATGRSTSESALINWMNASASGSESRDGPERWIV